MTVQDIAARDILTGDWIPGLDNAFVIEVTLDEPIWIREGSGYRNYPYVTPDTHVLITFNNVNGNEGYLIVDGDTPITIERN
jgi:hypothetical protein